MGCDIHLVIEVKHGDEWVGVATDRGVRYLKPHTDVLSLEYTFPTAGQRDYKFFANLNNVRGEMDKKLRRPECGLPDDMSPLCKMLYGKGDDWHSEAYMSLHEFVKRWAMSWEWLAGQLAKARLDNQPHMIAAMYDLAACGYFVSDTYENAQYDSGKGDKFMSFEEFCKTHVRVVFWFDN